MESMVKLPPLRINTSGWDAKFSDHRMHVQTGPTPFGSDAPFGRLAFSTDAAKDIGGQLHVRPLESLRDSLTSVAPSLRRVAIDARLADLNVDLSASLDFFGVFGYYTLSGSHGLVSNLALSAALADDEIDLMQPSEFAIDLQAKCAATDPHACTMWPRPRPDSAYLELPSPTSSGTLRGGSAGMHTQMRKPSFLSTLLDVLVGVSHSANARAAAKGDEGVDARLDLDIDDYHAFTHGIFTHDPTAHDGGWKGLLNASVPAGDKYEPLNLAAGLTSIDKLKYELSGIGSHHGESYRVVSHLDLGSSKPLTTGLDEHVRRLQTTSEEPPAPVHFDLAVTDMFGIDLDVHVNLDLVFDHGSVVLGGDLELNGVGATMNATVSYGCLFNWTGPGSCHTPLYADVLVAPVGESLDFEHPIDLNMTFDWHETEVNPVSMRAALVSGESMLDLGLSQEYIERTVAGEWEGAYTLAQRFSPRNIEWLESTGLDVHFTVGNGRLMGETWADIAGSGATTNFMVDTAYQSPLQSRRLSHEDGVGPISNASFTFDMRPHAVDWLAALQTHGQLTWEPSSNALALVGEGFYNSTGIRMSFAENVTESPYTVGFQLWPSHIEDFEPLEMQATVHIASPPPSASPSAVCSNTCYYSSDGLCDDGGSGAEYSDCASGTDCVDCGPRLLISSPPPPSPSPPPPTPSPAAPPSGPYQQQVNVRRHASSPKAHRIRPVLRARLILSSPFLDLCRWTRASATARCAFRRTSLSMWPFATTPSLASRAPRASKRPASMGWTRHSRSR